MTENVVLEGDCLDVMAGLDAESVDAVVTDPPYDLTGHRWDSLGAVPGDARKPNPHVRGRVGFMGKAWDGTGVAFRPETWAAALRVARPSAYLLAFGGTRTVHRMTSAIEDAGWIIRDMLVWAYASGFPKSKASLKPAWEPIVMARKPGPLRMLNIDACRITGDSNGDGAGRRPELDDGGLDHRRTGARADGSRAGEPSAERRYADRGGTDLAPLPGPRGGDPAGRWPSNVILTDALFDGDTEGVVGGGWQESTSAVGAWAPRGAFPIDNPNPTVYGDSGTYSRFFLLPRSPSDALSGIIGTCRICNAPIAAKPSTTETRQPDTAPSSAVTRPPASLAPDASDAASPSPSPATATAPRLVPTPLGGTPGSMASEDGSSTATDTSGTATSSWPEPTPDTVSPSDQPARTAEQPTTSTDTTTTTAAPWMCARCADDATHGRTLPPPRLIGREPQDDESPSYTRFLIIPKADRTDREPVLGGLPLRGASNRAMSGAPFGAWLCKCGRQYAASLERCPRCGDTEREPYVVGKGERANIHPTVKPTELMRHLVRLVTPPGGIVLDPFLGSGTTALACELEGFRWLGIEKEAEYVAIARARLNGTQRGMGLTA